jgi:hypothetical protein
LFCPIVPRKNGVASPRVYTHQGLTPCLVIVLLYLVAKLLLAVPLPMLTSMLWLSGEGTELSDRHCPIPSPHMGRHRLWPGPPGRCKAPRSGNLLWYGRFGFSMGRAYQGESAPIRGGSPTTIVTMLLMRVLVEKFLSQGLMGWSPILECLSIKVAWVHVAMSYHARL